MSDLNEDIASWQAGFRDIFFIKRPTWGLFDIEDHHARHSHTHPWRPDDPIETYALRQHHPLGRSTLVSEVNFYRACPIHLDELKSSVSRNGAELLVCPHGHRSTTWVAMGSNGLVVGQAWSNRNAMIVGERAKNSGPRAPLPPSHPCKRGHMDWTYTPSERKYHCASCKEKMK